MLPSLPKPEVKPKFIEFKDYTDDIICIPVATIIGFNTLGGDPDYNVGISIVYEGPVERNYYFKNKKYRDKVFAAIRSNFSINVVIEDPEKEYNKYDEDEDELPEEEPYVEDMREFGSYCL